MRMFFAFLFGGGGILVKVQPIGAGKLNRKNDQL
jgi:hypothetical protein